MVSLRMKAKRKILLPSMAGIAALLLIAVLTFQILQPRPITIMVSGLDEASRAAVSALVETARKNNPKILIDVVEKDSWKLSSHVSGKQKIDAVFFFAGAESDATAKQFIPTTAEYLDRFPQSFLPPVTANETIYAYPVFFDHYELDLNKKLKAAEEYKGSVGSLEKALFLKKDALHAPALFAGGEDDHLAALTSSLIAATGGISGYDSVTKAMVALPAGTKAADALEMFLDLKVSDGTNEIAVRKIVRKPAEWVADDFVHPGWLNVKKGDLDYLAERDSPLAFGTFLSQHRTMNHEMLELYETCPMPLFHKRDDLGTVNRTIALALYSDPSKNRNLKILLDTFLDPETVYQASCASGLVPGLSASRNPDRQARDVRSWILGSAKTVRGLDQDAFLSKESSTAFLAELRIWLMKEESEAR